MNGFAVMVRHLDAHRGLARNAVDQDGLGAHRQAEVIHEIGDAAVLDAGFGLELVGGDDRTGVNLRNRSGHSKLAEFHGQAGGAILQLILVDALLVRRRPQQRGAGKLVGVGAAPDDLGRRRRGFRLEALGADHQSRGTFSAGLFS